MKHRRRRSPTRPTTTNSSTSQSAAQSRRSVDYQPDDSPRRATPTSRQHDRVTLRLDIDRDFTTAFELTVDTAAGRTTPAGAMPLESQPGTSPPRTTTHLGRSKPPIPLAELVDKPPAARDVWAVVRPPHDPPRRLPNLVRRPASADSPDQFGLLIFE